MTGSPTGLPNGSPTGLPNGSPAGLRWRDLGTTDYVATWEAMRAFGDARDATTPDELWLTEHPAVFTQGRAGKEEHLLWPGEIPVVRTDRGGQVTYHGPGQVVAYPLLDLVRRGIGVRQYVSILEGAMLDVLGAYGVAAHARTDAPGVYLEDGAKIGSVGVRIRRGRTTHGLALNVLNDLEPFTRINPCGLVGMAVARLQERSAQPVVLAAVKGAVARALAARLGETLGERLG